MSIRRKNLQKILQSKYLPAERYEKKYSAGVIKSADLQRWLKDSYSELGGQHDYHSIPIPGFELEFGNFCVMLNEQLQFNRYRSLTLRSDMYQQLTSFPLSKYRIYCRKMEGECLKSGKSNPYWTNYEAEYHFGKPMEPGDLGLSGSSGWKLRAIQAMLNDAVSYQLGIRVVHLSIWDDVLIGNKLTRLGELLFNPDKQSEGYFLKYFERQLIKTYA